MISAAGGRRGAGESLDDHCLTITADDPRAAPRPILSSLLWLAVGCLALLVLALAWSLGGVAGWLYLLVYALATVPGLPIGFALFGRRHAAGWIGGALVGYALTAFSMWLPVQLHAPGLLPSLAAWVVATTLSFVAFRRPDPLVALPPWTGRDSLALTLVIVAVPIIVWLPFERIGAIDAEGNRRYRAYFTADFLWHVALTAELSRMDSPPRNPYLSSQPLHYYWTYFVVPAVFNRTGVLPLASSLAINALCAGMLFVSAIFIFAWCTVPRAGPAAAGTLLALLAASAEGLHAMWVLWQQGQPLDGLRHLNIDAITAWFLRGLTVDGLPRSLWYTPQHAAACALSLVALMVPAYAAPRRPLTGMLGGVALGLALVCSPFIGGAFSLVYGLSALWVAARSRGHAVGKLLTLAPAAVPVAAALGWCIVSGTFEGAGGAVAFGPSRLAMVAPFMVPALALGPLLVVAIPGLILGRSFHIAPAAAATMVGFSLFYLVTLTAEPIWIGWRAGQILLVALPGLAAATIHVLSRRGLAVLTRSVLILVFCAGLPTAAIDLHNAQDTSNAAMGPGFRWTVVVNRDTQAALDWIRTNTPQDAVVQMSIGPRGRETWTLIPTFAERRMAAGQPISLLRMREYDERSALADGLFRTADAREASRAALALHADFIFIDVVERQAFGEAAASKFRDNQYFTEVFSQGGAAVFRVR